MKLRNVHLRTRWGHRVEKHGKNNPQNENQGPHITNGKFPHSLLLQRVAFLLTLQSGGRFYSKRVIDVETFVADARRGDRDHFIVRADENLTAFVELEAALGGAGFTTARAPSRSSHVRHIHFSALEDCP